MIDLPQTFGKYTLVERIAIGGMAEIFKASAQGLGDFAKLLAIKRLHPRYSEDQDFIHMLVDEAKIASQLSHSNIGQIFDLGRVGDLIYIAMEFIDGRDLYRILRRLVEQGHQMPIEVAIFIIMEVCAGLDYAHRKTTPDGTPLQIIHRDISPQNVIVSWEGEVKLIDFGIAKAAMRAFETESGVIKGKFYYMSPEQARGDKLDHRSDIFSLGLCLYELLTGATVYREEDDVTLLSRVRRAEISPPTAMRPDIPLDLERIIMKALARNPKRRYQTAHQLQMALSSLLYSMGQPFSKPQLGAYMRDLFNREQVFNDVPIAYHDRFMSRVDYIGDGASMASNLFGDEDPVTAIVDRQRDTVRPGAISPDRVAAEAGVARHDPYAEIILDDLGDFEAAPTAAGSMMDLPYDEDEPTGIYPPLAEMILEETTNGPMPLGAASIPPPLPPPLPAGPDRSAAARPMPPALAPPPSALAARPPEPARRPAPRTGSIQVRHANPDYDPSIHTGIVTGVYNEPTRITDLDSMELEVGQVARPAPRAEPELSEVPSALKLLFAIGLAVILLIGGTISALAAVFIQGGDGSEQGALQQVALGQAEPGAPADAAAPTPPEQPAAAVPARPDTRALLVTVEGPAVASVQLGDVEPKPAPASFEGLVMGRTYTLKITADNHKTHVEQLTIGEDMASAYPVKVEARRGALKVITDPPGAAINLSGKNLDKTTPTNLGDLSRAERHTVTLTLDGHKPHVQEVTWADEDEDIKSVDVKLEPTTPPKADDGAVGALAVREEPREEPREVRRDPPAQPRESAAERRARIARERAERREREQRERRERERAASASPGGGGGGGGGGAQDYGTLSVNSRPWGHVYVDGRKVANETPVTGLRVKATYHSVMVVFPTLGGLKKTKTVPVKKGESITVFFTP